MTAPDVPINVTVPRGKTVSLNVGDAKVKVTGPAKCTYDGNRTLDCGAE